MRLLLIALVLGGLYLYVIKPHRAEQLRAAVMADMAPNANGFVATPAPAELPRDRITIFAALNCPKEGAQRAEHLAENLRRLDIPYQRNGNVSFALNHVSSQAEADVIATAIGTLMDGEAPIVFINGRARANPDLEAVLAEYRTTR